MRARTHTVHEHARERVGLATRTTLGDCEVHVNQPTVSDVMSRDVLAVAPDTSRESAARMLSLRNITGAPVVDAEGAVIGVVSLRDLVDPDASPEEGEGHPIFYRILDGWAETVGDVTDNTAGRVDEVMTRSAITVDADVDLLTAARRMLANRIHRLVVTQDGLLAGIVTTTDVLRGFVGLLDPDSGDEARPAPRVDA